MSLRFRQALSGLLRKGQQVKSPSPDPAGSAVATSSPRLRRWSCRISFFLTHSGTRDRGSVHVPQEIERSEVFEKGGQSSQTRDAQDEAGNPEIRLRQKGQEPEAGNRDRPLR